MILFEISCQFCHLENNSAAAAARLANLGRRDYSSLICPLFASAVRRPLMTPSSPKCHLCSVSALSTQFSDPFASAPLDFMACLVFQPWITVWVAGTGLPRHPSSLYNRAWHPIILCKPYLDVGGALCAVLELLLFSATTVSRYQYNQNFFGR